MKHTYDSKIEECVQILHDKVGQQYAPDYHKYREYCERLFSYAAEEASDELFAYAYFYMMQFYASDNDCVSAISCAREGIKYQLSIGEYYMAARSSNVLGVYMSLIGNFTSAID